MAEGKKEGFEPRLEHERGVGSNDGWGKVLPRTTEKAFGTRVEIACKGVEGCEDGERLARASPWRILNMVSAMLKSIKDWHTGWLSAFG